MQAIIFFYSMKEVEPKTTTTVLEQLFGRMKQSNYKYKYPVKGKLSDGEYIKPVKSVLIVKKENVHTVSKLFDSYKIKYEIREITLKNNDFEKRAFL